MDDGYNDLGTTRRPSAGIDQRDGRLSRGLSGTNLERAGDYNQRTVLKIIRLAGRTTRMEIAHETGLTAPAIANITNRLVDLGLIRTAGRKQGGRGQPALRLEIAPDGAYGVGLNIDRDHLTLVILDLAGAVRFRVSREIAFAMPQDVIAFVAAHLDAGLESAGIQRSRILGVGVAIPDDMGRITLAHQPPGYDAWNDLHIPDLLALLPWPVHRDNDAAAAALGEAQYGAAFETSSFFYILISAGLGGGPVIDRIYHRGATARSGEIGLMPDPGGVPGAMVQDTVSLSALYTRLEEAGKTQPDLASLTATDDVTTGVIDLWIKDSVRALTNPLVAINCLLDLDAVLIGGRLPLPLMDRLATDLSAALTSMRLPAHAQIKPAVMAQDAPAIGAAMLPFLHHLLPSDSILIQAGR